MDFITGSRRTFKKHDGIMVVIGKKSKVSHFVVVEQIFIKDIVRLHGTPKKIILPKDANFTSWF